MGNFRTYRSPHRTCRSDFPDCSSQAAPSSARILIESSDRFFVRSDFECDVEGELQSVSTEELASDAGTAAGTPSMLLMSNERRKCLSRFCISQTTREDSLGLVMASVIPSRVWGFQ